MPPVRIHSILVSELGDKHSQKSTRNNTEISDDEPLSLKQKVQRFSHEVSVIGVRCIFDPQRNWFRKSIWIALITASVALAVYQIRARIEFYFTYPTSTDVQFTVAPSLRLPQITICNENYISKRGANETGLETQLQQLFSFASIPYLEIFDSNRTQEEWDNLTMLLEPKWSIASVTFGQENVASSITQMETNMGLCYSLNSAKGLNALPAGSPPAGSAFDAANRKKGYNPTVYQAGTQYGAMFVIYVDQDDFLATHTPAAGVRVLMHDPIAKPLMFELGLQAGPGVYTSVAMTLERITQMPSPYSNCIDDVNYRMTNCVYDCQSAYMINHCQCRMPYMTGDARPCNMKDIFLCVFSTFLQYAINASCPCPPECVRVRYSYAVTQAALANTYLATVQQLYNVSSAEYNRNYVTVTLFYTALSFNDVTLTGAYDVMALLSDIGGALGLLLGATMLTIYEIGEFVYDLVADAVRRKMKAKGKTQGN